MFIKREDQRWHVESFHICIKVKGRWTKNEITERLLLEVLNLLSHILP